MATNHLWIILATAACLGAAAPTRTTGLHPLRPISGMTVGPIENAYHPGKGYGSAAYVRTLDELVRIGATWVAITPFGRVGSLAGLGVDPSFETPFEENRRNVRTAIDQAHARGLSVMLVPHLWVESGEWRALIDPGTDAGWQKWSDSYAQFVEGWAKVAEASRVDLFSTGVELRSWVTSTRAPSFVSLIRKLRGIYRGPLTYSANWDDVSDTIVLGELDVIGINAFYPLTDHEGASLAELESGGSRVADKLSELSRNWHKKILFTEIGYTTRADPAVRPWEWPDAMKNVHVDQVAQSLAYRGLLTPLLHTSPFAGFFVWRTYADPDDVSQEAEWGFSPRGKQAELVIRDAYSAQSRHAPFMPAARVAGLY